jgi:hypothetical protein
LTNFCDAIQVFGDARLSKSMNADVMLPVGMESKVPKPKPKTGVRRTDAHGRSVWQFTDDSGKPINPDTHYVQSLGSELSLAETAVKPALDKAKVSKLTK